MAPLRPLLAAGRCCWPPAGGPGRRAFASAAPAIGQRAKLPLRHDVLETAERLGSAALRGNAEAFEALVHDLRAQCVVSSQSRDLAHHLGSAALQGDTQAFGELEGHLRALLPLAPAPPSPPSPQPLAAPSPARPARAAPKAAPEAAPKAAPEAPRRHEEQLSPEDFVWSDHPFNDGEEGNARVLRGFEDEYARILADRGGSMKDAKVLRATLDLATAHVKNYSLDRADELFEEALDECRERGSPWSLKCLQDLATLRFKQNRQPECAELLEEVARSSPPHPATQENLGTAYNSMGDHRRALACFEKAVELRGGTPAKEDLWNIAIAKKNLGELHVAMPMLEVTLARFLSEAAECPVTIGKVHDTLAECYLVGGRAEDAAEHYRTASDIFLERVGKRSPLYGAATDGLSRALDAAGRPDEAFDVLVEAFEVHARMHAIHPTPLYELLERGEQMAKRGEALPEQAGAGPQPDLRRLVPAMEAAVENLARRGLDMDGNGGVVLQKLGQVFLACADRAAEGSSEAEDLRRRAAGLLRRARPLMEAATDAGEADLSELCVIAAMRAPPLCGLAALLASQSPQRGAWPARQAWQMRRPLLPARRGATLEKVVDRTRNKGASVAQSVFNLTKNILGIGVLSLPAAVAAGTGLAPAVLLTIALGMYSGYTFSLYGRVCEATGQRNFNGLGVSTGGQRWANVMTWVCTVRTVFSCLAFSIVMADSFSTILQGFGAPAVFCARNTVLGGMTLFILLPICLLPDLSALSRISFLGVSAMAYTMIFMVIRCLDGSYAPGGVFFEEALAAGVTSGRWAVNISTLVLVSSLGTACSAHYNAPRYYDQLRDRSVGRFNVMVGVAFSLVVGMCLAFMCAGYLTFGAASKGNILLNYSARDPLATAARIAVSSSVVCTYPLAFTGLRDGVMSLTGMKASVKNFRLTTLGLLSIVTALALAIRNVAFVVNLGGAIFGALTVYIFPSILYLLLPGRRSGPESQCVKITVANGIWLAVLGSTVAVLQEFFPGTLR